MINQQTVKVHYFWNEKYNKELPSGMSIHFYLNNNSGRFLDFLNTDGGILHVRGNESYSIISTNNDTERIIVRNENSYSKYEATTSKIFRVCALDSSKMEEGISQPDNYYVATVKNLCIAKTYDTLSINKYPENIIKEIPFTYKHIEGIEYLRTIRLAVSGLSSSFNVSMRKLSKETGLIFLGYRIKGNELEGKFKTFGFDSNNNQEFIIEFFYNGKVIIKRYDVTTMLSERKRIDIVDSIKFEPISNGSGFIPDVGDWDEEDVDFPI